MLDDADDFGLTGLTISPEDIVIGLETLGFTEDEAFDLALGAEVSDSAEIHRIAF
jgi:hypothetical protein